MPRDIVRGLEAGFFRYLTKPIRVSEFMDTLNEALAFAEKGVASEKMMPNQPSQPVGMPAAKGLANAGAGLSTANPSADPARLTFPHPVAT